MICLHVLSLDFILIVFNITESHVLSHSSTTDVNIVLDKFHFEEKAEAIATSILTLMSQISLLTVGRLAS